MIQTHKAYLLKLFEGEIDDHEIKSWLNDLARRGETVEELTGYALAMREKMIPITLSDGPLIDLCGTGGSGKERFNVSTTSAFVLASFGISVAKHGNYGSKQSNGSFNFTEALGLTSLSQTNDLKVVFDKTNLAFLFARFFHPAMKRVAAIRKELGIRTVFNNLGPLCNPASPTHQILGTTSIENAEKLAAVVQKLGTEKTLVVVGGDGTDELSLTGDNTIFEVTKDIISRHSFTTNYHSSTEYDCGDSIRNAELFQQVFSTGDVSHPIAKHVAVNAGAALWSLGKTSSIESGLEKALQVIENKSVYQMFINYKRENALVSER